MKYKEIAHGYSWVNLLKYISTLLNWLQSEMCDHVTVADYKLFKEEIIV